MHEFKGWPEEQGITDGEVATKIIDSKLEDWGSLEFHFGICISIRPSFGITCSALKVISKSENRPT
jgi:hypothetical protein